MPYTTALKFPETLIPKPFQAGPAQPRTLKLNLEAAFRRSGRSSASAVALLRNTFRKGFGVWSFLGFKLWVHGSGFGLRGARLQGEHGRKKRGDVAVWVRSVGVACKGFEIMGVGVEVQVEGSVVAVWASGF